MVTVANERFFPAQPDDVFAALESTVGALFSPKGRDPYTRSVIFSTPVTAFSWGANMSAQVLPVEGGSYVRVAGASKMAVNVTAKGAEAKHITRLLDGVSAHLQTMPRQKALPRADWYPDPDGSPRKRYWDGTRWTNHYWPPESSASVVAIEPAPLVEPSTASVVEEASASHAPRRPATDRVKEPSLALMLEQLALEAPRHPLDEQVEVAGETYHVKGIKKVYRAHKRAITSGGSTIEDVECVLVPEPWNPHDSNAIAVLIDTHHVGYLPAELAADYAECLGRLAAAGSLATGIARIWALDDGGVVRARVTVLIPECELFE